MISAFANTLKIPELRQRIIFTLLMILIVRLGAAITLPGVDGNVLSEMLASAQQASGDGEGSRGAGTMMALMNVFSGGGLQNCAIFALGIMPYISASIMIQLLTAVVPKLGKLSREEGGREKINLYTRYLTILLCLIQGYMLARSLLNPQNNFLLKSLIGDDTGRPLVPDQTAGFLIIAVLTMTAGTMLMMWLGEQITERGIGNGISLIITVNIIFSLPGALVQVFETFVQGAATDPVKPLKLVALLAFFLFVIAAVIAITQAQRRISIQYAKRMVGRKQYGGQTQYMPLKVNYAGVMPIIFAQAILLFPSQIIGMAFPNVAWAQKLAANLGGTGSLYFILSAVMIFFFSYFWVATMFQPNQIAEDLKRNGGYIPGVRPGRPTSEFLDYTMSRLTFAGAIFLTIVAILPNLLSQWMQIPPLAAQFFGGTSLLILVGVLLDMMRQIETHLIQRHYDGFLRKGRMRGRFERTQASGAVASSNQMIWLSVVAALLIILAVAYFLYQSRN